MIDFMESQRILAELEADLKRKKKILVRHLVLAVLFFLLFISSLFWIPYFHLNIDVLFFVLPMLAFYFMIVFWWVREFFRLHKEYAKLDSKYEFRFRQKNFNKEPPLLHQSTYDPGK